MNEGRERGPVVLLNKSTCFTLASRLYIDAIAEHANLLASMSRDVNKSHVSALL